MKKKFQIIIQVLFLLLFAIMMVSGKIQAWMGVFVAGLIVSIFFSRFYCGFACPMNTLMTSISFIKKKLKIKSFKIPELLTGNIFRYSVFILFILTFIFVMVSGKKIPVVPFLVSLSVVITIFFPPEFWHRYICPYGTILKFTSSKAVRQIVIDPDKCNNCTACTKVCPSKAIGRNDISHFIIKNECLVCFECTRVCKQNAISYK